MSSTSRLVLALTVAGVSCVAYAQTAALTVRYEVRATPDDQLALVAELRSNLESLEAGDGRTRAVASVIAHLEAIPKRWPAQSDAVLDAYLQQADVCLDNEWVGSAGPVLDRALPLARQRGQATLVFLRRARMHKALGDVAASRLAIEEAIRPSAMSGLDKGSQASTHATAARFFDDTGAFTDAAKAWNAAARHASSALERGTYRFSAVKARVLAGDKAAARAEAALTRLDLNEARQRAVNDAAAYDVLDSLERELAALSIE